MALPQLDKTAFSLGDLYDGGDEKAYWLSKMPLERLEALEIMREIVYGYDPATERISDFIEIIDTPRE